ncbi:hypothetical protein SAMN04488003_101387 [Loktanella fryxellensis]|uniref:SnoaL-like domain-containing protein n=1 Tax=Loktanella fryxellensis TaxID=245187 RepID=A0A1H7Z0B8_9RHOB|nr:hypothetical protein [Loktanella fryxellensis]SEM51611.1 hypothetical protein SAMN04488003_101387 [Loktanella fryxellensis]
MSATLLQDWLDRVAALVFADDFDGWADTMGQPLLVVNPVGRSSIVTRDQLRDKFALWRSMFDTLRVTHMIRTAHDSVGLDDDRLAGTYSTDLLSNGHRVMPRFASTIILTRQDGIWRATELSSGMAPTYRHLIHTDTPPSAAGTTGPAATPTQGRDT